MIRLYIATFVLVFTFSGCRKKEFTFDEFEAYVMDPSNGLCIEQKEGVIRTQVIYRPVQLLIAHELKNVEQPSAAFVDSVRRKYQQGVYFILNLSKNEDDILNELSGTPEYSSRLGTLSFGMTDYVYLVSSSQDTIHLSNYNYSRMYGVSGVTSLFLVFKYSDLEKSEWVELILEEAGLGVGRKQIRFNSSDLTALPELKF